MGKKVDELTRKVDALQTAVKQAGEEWLEIDGTVANVLYFVWEALRRVLTNPESAKEFIDALDPDWFEI